jgi:hypothetical protein
MDSLGTFSTPASAIDANALTVATTAMNLSKNTTYANQTVVLPQTAYKVGSWNLAGSSVEDVLVSTLSFDIDLVTVSADDFTSADFTNMYAVVKLGGNTVYTTSPISTASAADNNFSLNYTLMKNTSVGVEFYATLGSTVTAAEKVKTDLTVTGTSLVSGQSITATSADTDGQTLTAGSGSITATADASAPVTAIVYDNQTVRTAAFKFAAVNSGYKITDLTFTIPAAGATSVTTVNISSTTESFSAVSSGGATVVFSGLDWDIPANVNAILNVDLVLGTVGYGYGTSGASLLTALDSGIATSASTGASAAITETNPAGNVHYVYASIPKIDKVSFSSADALQNGDNTLVKFTIAANGGDIEWDWLFFEVTKTADPILTNATLWDVTGGGNTEIAGTDTLTTVGATNTSGSIQFTPTAVQQISGSKTYELRITASAVDADVDSVVTRMAQDATYLAPDQVTDVDADVDATIIWSDVSAQSHATTTDDWSADFGVKSLPFSQTISS